MTGTTTMRLLTIVAEAVLEHRLVDQIQRSGAAGHTVTACHGSGSRGVRAGVAGEGNIRIEVVCTPVVADAVLGVLAEDYFPHYALVVWMSDVTVLRPERFGTTPPGRGDDPA